MQFTTSGCYFTPLCLLLYMQCECVCVYIYDVLKRVFAAADVEVVHSVLLHTFLFAPIHSADCAVERMKKKMRFTRSQRKIVYTESVDILT